MSSKRIRKGKPQVIEGRKATGLLEKTSAKQKIAGLPNTDEKFVFDNSVFLFKALLRSLKKL